MNKFIKTVFMENNQIKELLHKHQYVVTAQINTDTPYKCVFRFPEKLSYPTRPIAIYIFTAYEHKELGFLNLEIQYITNTKNRKKTIKLPSYALSIFVAFYIISKCDKRQYNINLIEFYVNDNVSNIVKFWDHFYTNPEDLDKANHLSIIVGRAYQGGFDDKIEKEAEELEIKEGYLKIKSIFVSPTKETKLKRLEQC